MENISIFVVCQKIRPSQSNIIFTNQVSINFNQFYLTIVFLCNPCLPPNLTIFVVYLALLLSPPRLLIYYLALKFLHSSLKLFCHFQAFHVTYSFFHINILFRCLMVNDVFVLLPYAVHVFLFVILCVLFQMIFSVKTAFQLHYSCY